MITITPTATTLNSNAFYRAVQTNPVLADAMSAAAPAVTELTRQLEQLAGHARAISSTTTMDNVARNIRTALTAGKPLPDDTLARVARIATENAALEQTARVLNDVATQISNDRDEAVRAASTAVLRHLHDQLTSLLADTDSAAPRDAETAVHTDQVDEFQRTLSAAETYAQIRRAQNTIARATWGIEFKGQPAWWDTLAFLSTPDTWADFLDWFTRGYALDEYGNRKPHLTPPWPQLDTPEAFAWLLDHPAAGAWVPTREQYTEAINGLDRAQSVAVGTLIRSDRKPAALV